MIIPIIITIIIIIIEKSLVKTTKNQSEEPKLILIPWEDKNTFVFQLKVGTRTLSRRIDNHTVNGTKLLNIGGLTRGRRDGILKNEKERNVIKHGPLNLKGVWYVYLLLILSFDRYK